VAFEQGAMLDAVNAELRSRRKSLTTLNDIIKIEQTALGHVDYSNKFALHCAELVLKEKIDA
jgi:hypothetical protein